MLRHEQNILSEYYYVKATLRGKHSLIDQQFCPNVIVFRYQAFEKVCPSKMKLRHNAFEKIGPSKEILRHEVCESQRIQMPVNEKDTQ